MSASVDKSAGLPARGLMLIGVPRPLEVPDCASRAPRQLHLLRQDPRCPERTHTPARPIARLDPQCARLRRRNPPARNETRRPSSHPPAAIRMDPAPPASVGGKPEAPSALVP